MVKDSIAINCPSAERWRRWLSESESTNDYQRLDHHLSDCDNCQKTLDRLTSQTSWSWIAADVVIEPMDKTEPVTMEIPGIEIIGEAGRGGHGVVFQARQIRLNRIVAVKLLRHGIAASDNERSRILTEAESLARLKHPNILQIYTTGESLGCPYLIMEWADAGSLADQLDGTPWKPNRVVDLIETLSRAIHAAHSAGVIHRDFKPENILMQIVDGVEVPKISDFGLAKLVDTPNSRTTSMTVLGTPNYMAPEQTIGGERSIGPATDVYALGVVMYELLTGRPPFMADTPFETLMRVREDEPLSIRQLQPRIPIDLETICLYCLHKEPSRRYSSAQELADDLNRFREGRPIVARPIGTVEKACKWIKRHPMLTLLMVLAIVGSFGGIITWNEINRKAAQAQRVADAHALVDSLIVSESSQVSRLLADLEPFRGLVADYLLGKHHATPPKTNSRLNANLALLATRPDVLPEILDQVPTATPTEIMTIRSQIKNCPSDEVLRLWSIVNDDNRNLAERLRTAGLLVGLTPQNKLWKSANETVARAIVAENPIYVGGWAEVFRPSRQYFIGPLAQISKDARYSEAERTIAADLVANFSAELGRDLAKDFLELEPKPALAILPAIKKLAVPAKGTWIAALETKTPDESDEPTKDIYSKRRVRAAIGLWHLNDTKPVEKLLALSGPDVRDRYYLIQMLSQLEVSAEFVVRQALHSQNAVVRRSALIALGDYSPTQFAINHREELRRDLEKRFMTDPDPGVHSAIDWLAGQAWSMKDWPPALPQTSEPANGKHWYVTPARISMTVIEGPVEFTMGSEPTEPHHDGGEFRLQCRMTHNYAIATREVTVAEFGEFLKANPTVSFKPPGPDDRLPEHAARRMSWFTAMQYCRWLSERENIPEAEIPYPPMDQIRDSVSFPPRHLQRTGYRLPTEEEWEHSCRCGTTTPRFYGFDRNHLYRFAWLLGNSEDACHAPGLLRPNDLGMFDIYGNVWEWTHPITYRPYSANSLESTAVHLDTATRPNLSSLVARGGSYIYHAPFVRSAKRYWLVPAGDTTVGFRIARTIR